MDAAQMSEPTAAKGSAKVERTSDRELVVTRTMNGSARIVFDAWTRADLLKQWWTPKSFPITLLSCEIDARVGGGYRLVYGYEGTTMEFFGRYLEVVPSTRLVWTNDEVGGEATITTVTFEDAGGKSRLVIHDRYPSKEALDDAIASGSTSGMPEALDQLDEVLAVLG